MWDKGWRARACLRWKVRISLAAMRFAVLGSGSAGNSAIVECDGVRVLLDAGLSGRALVQRLAALGMTPGDLDAILLTHEHGDHVRGVKALLKKWEVPIYASLQTAHVLRADIGGVWRTFEAGQSFPIGALQVESFSVMHDAIDPVGFVLRGARSSLGFLSDLGFVPEMVKQKLVGVCGLFIEANYDDAMLEADTKRPWSTKQRISSRHGHLSNAQVAALLESLVHEGLQQVVLGHLSRDCNAPDVAFAAVSGAMERALGRAVPVACARQDEVSPWWRFAPVHPVPRVSFSGAFEQGELF